MEASIGGGRSETDESYLLSRCGYYLREEHHLIRRQEESLNLNADHTARWQLRVDFELPSDPEAMVPDGDDAYLFMFPVVFLRKNESRMMFRVYEEERGPVPIPTRAECDNISAEAVSQAINHLAARIDPKFQLDEEELKNLVCKIPAARALEASLALQYLRRKVGILPLEQERELPPRLAWLSLSMVSSGLNDALQMLVEHALLWVKVRGRPGEQRSVTVEQEITLRRRSLMRWSFGSITNPLKPPKPWNLHWKRLQADKGKEGETLKLGRELYGRRDRRPSPTAVGERIGQVLAWMPFEFALPTIYAKRCGSYHFEVRCPQGRSPRNLKVLPAPPDKKTKPKPAGATRKTFSARSVRFDVPRGGLEDIKEFRVIVGIGNSAFPLLWFLAAAVTTLMLWILAGSDPGPGEEAQTAAGILLIVPALVAGLAATGNQVPISQLIGGARVLLLTTGLSAVLAAAVLAGMRPFHLSRETIWSACAIAATVMTLPLATSWLLAKPSIWSALRRLNTYRGQKLALAAGGIAAVVIVAALAVLPDDTWYRIAFAVLLLALMVGLSALASSRSVLPLKEDRRYLGATLLLAGLTCLALGCFELHCLIYEHALGAQSTCTGPVAELDSPRQTAELGAVGLLTAAFLAGRPLSALARRADAREDEIHLSPQACRALLEEESVGELTELSEILRELQAPAPVDPVSNQSPPGVGQE